MVKTYVLKKYILKKQVIHLQEMWFPTHPLLPEPLLNDQFYAVAALSVAQCDESRAQAADAL